MPVFDAGDTFDMCAERIKSFLLRSKMKSIRQHVVVRSADYDARAKVGDLHLVGTHKNGIALVAGSDLIKNYTGRMVPKSMPARAVYDALKSLPRNDRCPFCRYGTIETLDHVLPKETYPGFSVSPHNLVGCCTRCNKRKHNLLPTRKDDCIIHPYFDDVDRKLWLAAEIVETTPAAALFRVDNASGLDASVYARVKHQFDVLGLENLYSNVASEEIAGIEEELEDVIRSGRPEDVAAHLLRKSRSWRKKDQNTWQAALYLAMSSSEWYCRGGFRTLKTLA